MKSPADIAIFDASKGDALRRIWFCGDVHNHFDHLKSALAQAVSHENDPRWVLFLGDLDLVSRSLQSVIDDIRESTRTASRFGFIHGNHDADTHEKWELLHQAGDCLKLHGKVCDLDGIRVAGLGGNFLGRVWYPPAEPSFQTRAQAMGNRSTRQKPRPSLNGGIYPDEYKRLFNLRADVLITHEAPSCHQHGWSALDDLARSLGAFRAFHGHTHDDLSEDYSRKTQSLGFDARAVNFCSIKNGLGELVRG